MDVSDERVEEQFVTRLVEEFIVVLAGGDYVAQSIDVVDLSLVALV